MKEIKIQKYQAYKPSGVEWLGEIPKHWEVRRIKTISRIKRGASPRPIDDPRYFNDDGEFSWVRISDVTSSNHYLFSTEQKLSKLGANHSVKIQPNDLFLSIAGSVGKPMISKIKCCIHDGFVYFPDLNTSTLNVEYLFRIFETGQPYLGLGKFGTQLNLNTETVGQISVPFPPLCEQTTIAEFLDYKTALIDKAIGIKEKQIELLKERRQILIHRAITRGLYPKVKLKDSGVEWIGEVPEHWEVRRSKFIFTQRKELARDNDIQLSATQAYGVIPQDEYERRIARKVVKIQFHLEKRKHVEVDDFVISMRSFQGGLERAWSSGCIRSSYIVLKPIEEIDPSFYSHLFKMQRYIMALQSTASFIRDGQDLNFDNFSKVDLFVPPINEQREISSFLESQFAKIATAISLKEKEIEKLKEYKASLINEVVTGKIKVN